MKFSLVSIKNANEVLILYRERFFNIFSKNVRHLLILNQLKKYEGNLMFFIDFILMVKSNFLRKSLFNCPA